MIDNAIILFSGGLDSTVALFWARERFSDVKAVCFDYGQTHSVEIESALKIGKKAGVDVDVINLAGAMEGPLIGSNVPKDEETGFFGTGTSSTVHGRNMVFLSILGQRAKIENYNTIIVGFDSDVPGGEGHPDTSYEFVKASQTALALALDIPQLRVVAPLIGMNKAEIVKEAAVIDGCYEALAYTHTCFRGSVPPCGVCQSCMTRRVAFWDIGLEDPLLKRCNTYKKRKKGQKTPTQGTPTLFVVDGTPSDH